jgi:hypothetical protein
MPAPLRSGVNLSENRPDGYRLLTTNNPPTVWILGADRRGALYGVGEFLRRMSWSKGKVSVPGDLDISSAPAYPIRGHQLGYRAQANCYDGWDERTYDQYIRELALFGANAVEGIPFQDERKSPHMPVPRDRMNRAISRICAKYGLEYWIWSAADFDLNDRAKRAESLAKHESLFRECLRMDGVFFPGGDPGSNPPDLVIPYLEELAGILRRHHPKGKVWLSLQWFKPPQIDTIYRWIEEKQPNWLGGLVAGPSSPPLAHTRARLPKRYGLRDYPDITHTVRCQYEVPFWDLAYSLTLGRECPNPRPAFYKIVHGATAKFTNGFISYSDGVNDDLNKAVWSRLGWDPKAAVRDIVVDYCRFFFGSTVAESAADGILALEKNWEGPLATNGSVDATLALWQRLERAAPELRGNWRWNVCLLRAYYDAYTRHRLINEAAIEKRANDILIRAASDGSAVAIRAARAELEKATSESIQKEWRARIETLCDVLFKSILLQTSVPKYGASGYERGCVLDFVDLPLNNRWWLEDEMARIEKLETERERVAELARIARWEDPGEGGYYDEVGHVARSPHVVRGEGVNTDPAMERNPNPGYWWWDNGKSRRRLSWQTSMGWPIAMVYDGLDPAKPYLVRMTGYGEAKPRANGQLLVPTRYGKEIGEIKEFSIPMGLLKDGTLRLTFDPIDERHLNWRQHSRVSEVWLMIGAPR